MTQHEPRTACAASLDSGLVEAIFAELAADLAPVCRRSNLRANVLLYLRGLLMPGVAGNCWSIAEAVGLDRPYRLQHLLERAMWDEDAARDAVRSFLARHLGADGGVLIFDETGQAKKGTMTAAAGRQYSGTMGRIANVIVAVYTTYATERGHALIDRDLYVQEDWHADPARMAQAGFPGTTRSPPNRSWLSSRRNECLPPGSIPRGRRATRYTGAVANCASSSSSKGSATCSRCPSTTGSPPPAGCVCA